ncbi:hypothetical protein D3C75_982080 [compost metagenome]
MRGLRISWLIVGIRFVSFRCGGVCLSAGAPHEPSFGPRRSDARVLISSKSEQPNEKAGTRALGVPAGTARPFNCHDLDGRRTAHVSKVRAVYARWVKASSDSPRQGRPRPIRQTMVSKIRHAWPFSSRRQQGEWDGGGFNPSRPAEGPLRCRRLRRRGPRRPARAPGPRRPWLGVRTAKGRARADHTDPA